jgi:hypothetical protein
MALLILEDHWLCALLRAALLERRRDAECAPSLRVALLRRREATRVILVDQHALSAPEYTALEALAAMDEGTRILLLGGSVQLPLGPWDWVLRRPIVATELLRIVGSALDGTLPRVRSQRTLGGMALRRCAPWPMIRCDRCRTARHYESARGPHETTLVAADAARFVLEHVPCGVGERNAGSYAARPSQQGVLPPLM